MIRKTQFSIGRRWFCKREGTHYRRPDFDFLIVGAAADKPQYKLCKLVVPGTDQYIEGESQPREFHRNHLKKYAVLKEES